MINKKRLLNTTFAVKEGNLIYCPSDDIKVDNMRAIGFITPDWSNFVSSAPMMFKTIESVVEGMENLLTFHELQGNDHLASKIQECIGSLKIVQSIAIFGESALTGSNLEAKKLLP